MLATIARYLNAHQRRAQGVVHVTGLLPQPTVADLTCGVDWLYARLAQAETAREDLGGTVAGKRVQRTYREWGGLQYDAAIDFLAEQDPIMARRFGQGAEEFAQRVCRLLGSGWRWLPHAGLIRRARPNALAGWHTDAEAASTPEQASARSVTVWTPLVPVGDALPSLEFVRGSHRFMATRPAIEPDRHRSVEWVDTVAGERWTPRAEPGDVFVFDEFTLHRSQVIEGQIGVRTSVDFRFLLDAAPDLNGSGVRSSHKRP